MDHLAAILECRVFLVSTLKHAAHLRRCLLRPMTTCASSSLKPPVHGLASVLSFPWCFTALTRPGVGMNA